MILSKAMKRKIYIACFCWAVLFIFTTLLKDEHLECRYTFFKTQPGPASKNATLGLPAGRRTATSRIHWDARQTELRRPLPSARPRIQFIGIFVTKIPVYL